MAIVKNNPYPDVPDYINSYQNWTPITLPSGEVVYEVPGHPERVFVPSLSNASGKVVLRPNPKLQIEEDAKTKETNEKLLKQQEFNQSPAGQLIPVGASIGGLYAASKLGSASSPLAEIGAKATADAAAQAAASGASSAAPVAVLPGTTTPATIGGFTSTGGEAATGLAVPNFGSIGAGPLAAVAAGTYLGGKSAYDLLQGKEDKSIPGMIGRGTLGIATGGISEIARPFLMKPSTRDIAKKHTGELLDAAGNDANAQAYIQGMREQYNSAPVDPSKPFAGKYSSWDEYKKAGLESGDLTGVYGNIKTYGPEWASLTQAQRQAITQANIDSGIYDSKKGEVEITDAQKALENKNNVLKGFAVGAETAATPVPVAATPAVTPAQAAAQGAVINKGVLKPRFAGVA